MSVFWPSITISLVLVATLLWAVQQALATVRLYKRTPFSDAMYTLRCTLRGRNAWVFLLPIASVVVFGVVLPLRSFSYPKDHTAARSPD